MKKLFGVVLTVLVGLLLVGCNSDETVIVSFDVNGGSPEVVSQEIPLGSFAIDPEVDLVKEGFTFNCWQLEGDDFEFIDTEVLEDITLVACYTEDKKVTLTHVYDFSKLDETKSYVKEETIFDVNNELTSNIDKFNKLHTIITTNKKLELRGAVLALRPFSQHKPAYLGTNSIIENLNSIELSYNVWGNKDNQMLELVKGIYLQTSSDGNNWETIRDIKDDIVNKDEFTSTIKVDVEEGNCYFRIYVEPTLIQSSNTFRILVNNIKFFTK